MRPKKIVANTVIGPIGDNTSSTFNTSNYIGGADDRIERRLSPVKQLPPFEAHADVDTVELWVNRLLQHRLVLIERSRHDEAQARSALYSLLARLEQKSSSLTRHTCTDNDPLSLSCFQRSLSWMDTHGNSVIYLDRSQVIDSFRHEFVQDLCKLLTDANSHLILVTRASSASGRSAAGAVHAAADVGVWRVAGTASDGGSRGDEEWDASIADPVGTVLLFCAAAFPGLGMAEYTKLCTCLLPAAASLGATAENPAAAGEPAASSSLARWHRGERDALMRLHGVSFQVQTSMVGEAGASAAGCYLQGLDSSLAAADRLFAQCPAFLADQFPALTEMYFCATWSSRFDDGYLRYLVRLHASHLHPINALWLASRYRLATTDTEPYRQLELLIELLYRLLEQGDGDVIVSGMLDLLVQENIERENSWLLALDESKFSEALLRLEADSLGAASPTPGWQAIESAGLKTQYEQFAQQIAHLHWCLLMLMRHPRSARMSAAAATTVLAGPASREPWAALVEDHGDAGPQVSPSHGIFMRSVLLLVKHDPALLAPFADAIGQTLPPWGEPPVETSDSWCKRICGNENARKNGARFSLTNACLAAFEAMLDAAVAADGFSSAAAAALFGGDGGRRCGELMATLLAGRRVREAGDKPQPGWKGNSIDTDGAFHLYEQLCQALVTKAPPGSAEANALTAKAIGFISPMRRHVSAQEHLELLSQARAASQIYRDRRTYFSHRGMREKEKRENARIRAIDLLMRALSTRIV